MGCEWVVLFMPFFSSKKKHWTLTNHRHLFTTPYRFSNVYKYLHVTPREYGLMFDLYCGIFEKKKVGWLIEQKRIGWGEQQSENKSQMYGPETDDNQSTEECSKPKVMPSVIACSFVM